MKRFYVGSLLSITCLTGIAILTITLSGCKSSNDVANTPNSPGIHVEDARVDRPEFKRTYTVQITEQVSIKIKIKNEGGSFSKGSQYNSGELDQKDGKWVLFDPDNPADKIIDRELLPIVQKYCKQIFALDKQYRESDPATFTDEDGHVWRREQ